MGVVAERCDFQIGNCINERYKIEKVLGEGSFGIVFKVKDQKTGQTLALKLFKFWEMRSEERESMMPRFVMEFETGQIKSDYLVKSIERGLVRGNPFIVMEFCPNGDLLHYVGRQPHVDFEKVAREILYGLKDLHSCGKVHRDLKPENVLINTNGNALLTDFGLSGDKAKRVTKIDFLGRPTEWGGTLVYMPPEQENPTNREVTVLPTMDIFAFGVLMFVIITNEYPFGPLNTHDDLANYCKNRKAGNWNQDVLASHPEGRKFDKVIAGCLIPDFKKRLQTVDFVLPLISPSHYHTYRNADISFQKQVVKGVLLRIMQGEEYGAVYKLNDLINGRSRIITIGCNDPSVQNVVQIIENQSRYISRKHATLEMHAGNQWFIRDGQWDRNAPNGWKRSLNGTFVNSTEVSSQGMPVQIGDIITVGDVKLRVEGY